MLPDPPPILRGKEAKAFLEDIKKPLTEKQREILKRALTKFDLTKFDPPTIIIGGRRRGGKA